MHSGLVVIWLQLVLEFISASEQCQKFIADPSWIWRSKFLNGYTLQYLERSNDVMCAMECLRRVDCKSFNFYKNNRMCVLNTESHLSQPKSWTTAEDDNVVYSLINPWSKKMVDNCAKHNCTSGQVCYSFWNSFRCLKDAEKGTPSFQDMVKRHHQSHRANEMDY
ncbi:hypothetical protein SNE40_018874 [Patella caerulea]|uniref:Apple domain-containing protein n=1 Tax=Patella caerulea TaxID=87958 RepID=A0AAN8J9F1_PATCE